MRKLKLLMAACALMVGVSANAYTTTDLESAGWSKVTASSITGISDNYYMLVDAKSSAYVMSCDATHYRPCYKTLDDPVVNPSFVWILEGSDNKFALKSYATGAYFKQTSGWDTTVGHGKGKSNVTGEFTLNSGKYDIKCVESNGMVGHWNDGTAGVANNGEDIAANKSTEHADGFLLYAISKADYNAAVLASRATTIDGATKASPVDVTAWIQNADWSGDWGGWECTLTSVGNQQWGQKTLESWNANSVVVKQELRGVPNGKYKVTADLISGSDANKAAYVFATGDEKVSSDAVSAVASAGNYTTMSNEVAGNTLTADNVSVTGNAITVGFDQSTGWIVADNFKLYYYGPNLAASDALPASSMTPNTWYYFDIAVDGKYNLACTTLSDIVYTTDGSILVEDAGSVTTTFAESSAEITAGRYYVKSSSAQTLAVTAASYSYTVGDATISIANGSYLQNLTTISFSFASAATNDPGATFDLLDNTAVATLKKAGSDVSTGTLSLSGTTLTATFSSVTLDVASSYTIELPADVLGYAGKAQNEAASVSFNTPAVFDGVYYMYNTDTKNYISRSGNYATQAIMDNWGLAFNVSTDANNNTKLQYFDSQYWLGDDGFCYGDCSGDRVRSYNVTKVEGGYKFLNTNNSCYLAVYNGLAVGDAVEGDNLQGTSNIWSLESTTAHVANYAKNENAQAATAASEAGLTGITTKAALEAELSNSYGATSISITGAKAEQFQKYAGNSMTLNENTYYSETVSGLEPGLYKLSVDAFQRAAGNNRVSAADGARSLIYLYAGSAKTQLKSIMDAHSTTAYDSDYAYDGKHYPDNLSSAYTALENCDYSNDVYVYVPDAGDGTGSLEIGIKNPTRLGGDFATWAVYNNWTLTYYEAKATAAEKEALADAITDAETKTLGFETGEYAPYNNIEALTKLAAAKAVNPETASGVEVVAATTALTGATWTANTTEENAIYWKTDYTADDKAADNYVHPIGWTNTGYNTRIMCAANDAASNPAMTTIGTAVFSKFNTTYGETVGYTMPLKAGKIYKITFKYCGWGNNPTTNVVLTDPESNIITLAPGFRPSTNDGNANAEHWYNYTGYFVSTTAGNYVLAMNKVETGQQQIAWADMQLVSASELEFADGSVPTYAPGTYPAVKITRTLTADKWATAVYPFVVSGVDKIAVLDSYNKSTGALGFKSATTSVANEPFLMRSNSNKSEIELSNVAVAAASVIDAKADEASLKGTYEAIDITNAEKNYVLSNNTIYPVGTAGATINPYRAYIQVAQDAEARLSFFVDDEEVTGIEGIQVEKVAKGTVYNLNGQRVEKAKKGLYIQNGKKVVVK